MWLIGKTQKSMLLRRVAVGSGVNYGVTFYSSGEIEWYLPTDEAQVRTPQEITMVYSAKDGFFAAGKHYDSVSQLCLEEDLDTRRARDIHGREVLYLKERFPCFDSYDLLYENRYYRWFFIRQDNSLTRVYQIDGRDRVYVTEDVRNLENKCWEQMKKLCYAVKECHDPY